jgi:hypothetical protein
MPCDFNTACSGRGSPFHSLGRSRIMSLERSRIMSDEKYNTNLAAEF